VVTSKIFSYELQNIFYLINFNRYFGAAKDLPGVRELFEQEGKKYIY